MGRSKRDRESFQKALAKRKKEMMELASSIARQTGLSIHGANEPRSPSSPGNAKSRTS